MKFLLEKEEEEMKERAEKQCPSYNMRSIWPGYTPAFETHREPSINDVSKSLDSGLPQPPACCADLPSGYKDLYIYYLQGCEVP